jgi:hypothetical protein
MHLVRVNNKLKSFIYLCHPHGHFVRTWRKDSPLWVLQAEATFMNSKWRDWMNVNWGRVWRRELLRVVTFQRARALRRASEFLQRSREFRQRQTLERHSGWDAALWQEETTDAFRIFSRSVEVWSWIRPPRNGFQLFIACYSSLWIHKSMCRKPNPPPASGYKIH